MDFALTFDVEVPIELAELCALPAAEAEESEEMVRVAVAAGENVLRVLSVAILVDRALAEEAALDCGVTVTNEEGETDVDVAALGLTLGDEEDESETRTDGDAIAEPEETREVAPDFEASGVNEPDETVEPERDAVTVELTLDTLVTEGAEDVEL